MRRYPIQPFRELAFGDLDPSLRLPQNATFAALLSLDCQLNFIVSSVLSYSIQQRINDNHAYEINPQNPSYSQAEL